MYTSYVIWVEKIKKQNPALDRIYIITEYHAILKCQIYIFSIVLQYIGFFDSMPIMDIAYISLILSFLTNLGLMYIILRLVRTTTGQRETLNSSLEHSAKPAPEKDVVGIDVKPDNQLNSSEEVYTYITPQTENRGESLVHLFSGYDDSYAKREKKANNYSSVLQRFIPSRQIVLLVGLAVGAIVLLGLLKQILPSISRVLSDLTSFVSEAMSESLPVTVEPFVLSSILMSMLALSFLIHAVRNGKRVLRIGSFVFLLGSMLYGAYVVPSIDVAYGFISLVTIAAALFAAHRRSYKKLWLTFIAGVLSFAIVFVRLTSSTSENVHSLYLFLLLVVVFGVSLYIAEKQVVFDAEDAFFVASGPMALGFLTQGVVNASESQTIGVFLIVAATLFGVFVYYSKNISDKYKSMAAIALGGLLITGAYSIVPSAWYNLIIALLALALLYFTASKGRVSAYIVYAVGFLAVTRLLIMHGGSSGVVYFANTAFVTHVVASLLVFFLAGVLYQNAARLPFAALNRFAVFFGILVANLIFSVGALSEFARMYNQGIISGSDFAVISLVGLVLHGAILVGISMYRKTRGILSIGVLFILAAFAKFYILDMEQAGRDVFSLITLGGISMAILLVVLFPDYKKYLPK